jgi:integrase
MRDGKRREMGLGTYGEKMKLREARWTALPEDKARETGADLIADRRAEKKVDTAERMTFSETAERYIEDVGRATWKAGGSGEDEFRRLLNDYCGTLLNMKVADVGVQDVVAVLKPWVKERPTMVAAVASVIKRVLDTAVAHEWRPLGVNPASKAILGKVLVVRHTTTHLGSMRWEDAPAFYQELLSMSGPRRISVAALRLLMLTALRKMEILGLRWDEVNLDDCTLRIDAARMKGKREHIVPLSREACDLLKGMRQGGHRGYEGRWVFPSKMGGGHMATHLSGMALSGLLPEGVTVHGMRATFRSWVEDKGWDESLAEHALAHGLKDSVQKAYRRSTAVERRRELMQAWADHVAG